MSHFNEVANSWDSPQKIERSKRFANEIKKEVQLDNNLDIMDFGCGTGVLGFEFIESAKSLLGIDTSQGMLDVFDQKASKLASIESKNINLEIDELDQKFDLIMSSMAFHHLDHPDKMLSKFSKMLNVGGKILIIDLETEDGTFHPDNDGMGVKHYGFSKDDLSRWGRNAGLSFSCKTVDEIIKNERSYNLFLSVFY